MLVPKWAYQTMAGGKFETTPLVVDGVLYGTGQDNRAFALDARLGAADLAISNVPCRPTFARAAGARIAGWPFLGDKVFLGTLDGACYRAGCKDRERRVGRHGRGVPQGLQHHACAAGDQESCDHRSVGRGIWDSWIH